MESTRLTKDEAEAVLAAHLAFEAVGGSRPLQWYAGVEATRTQETAVCDLGVP